MSFSPIDIVLSCDENYAQHLAVAIASILENNRGACVRLHLVHDAISQASLDKIRELVDRYEGATLSVYPFDSRPYEHFRIEGHISLASYFRLFLADLLPKEIAKVIYLDVDLVVLSDLRPLWSTNLSGAWIGAIPDLYANSPDLFADSIEDLPSSNERLGLPADYVYFNAGVLLIDLETWRRESISATFVDYVNSNSAIIRFHDQDVLNAILGERVKYLDYTWNFQAKTRYEDTVLLDLSEEEFRRLTRNPKIVHFTTRKKPWLYAYQVPFEAEYFRYLRKTPWRGYVPPDRTLRRVIGRRAPLLRAVYKFLGKSRPRANP